MKSLRNLEEILEKSDDIPLELLYESKGNPANS